jgi:hypothetical protein
MAIKPDENTASTSDAPPSPARTSELDLTRRNTGPIWRQYLRAMGPGLVTGTSDDDPPGSPPTPRRGPNTVSRSCGPRS